MELNKSQEQIDLGQRLHSAEFNIYLAKQAIVKVLSEEPVDQTELERHKEERHEARLARNAIRHQLDQTKRTGSTYGYRVHRGIF